MRKITVACRKKDSRAYSVQKYDNNESWNVRDGRAPNGVNATRYLRKTIPDTKKLSPLAAWLVENVRGYVAGKIPPFQAKDRVICYYGKSIYEQMLHIAKTNKVINGIYYETIENAISHVESIYRMYGKWYDEPAMIDGWVFSIIEPNQTDNDYWNSEAEKMHEIGIKAIETNGKRWEAKT